jgi:probable HAF family extracellular repeat protein
MNQRGLASNLKGTASINASGEIVGFGQTRDGEVHGFLAIPNNSGAKEDSMSPVEERVRPMPASESARKLLYQRLGIRKR